VNHDLPPSLIRYGAELEQAIRRELGAGGKRSGSRSLRHRRRARRAILTAGASFVAVATVIVLLLLGATTTTPPAYAFTRNQDGSVTVTLHDLATAIPALNAKFARLGIDETVIPVTPECKTAADLLVSPTAAMSESLTLTAGRKYLLPGWRGVLAAKQLPNGKVGMVFGALKPPLPSCFSSQVYTEPTRLLGHRHPTSATSRQPPSATSASATSLDAQTLLLAKQAVASFEKSHANDRRSP